MWFVGEDNRGFLDAFITSFYLRKFCVVSIKPIGILSAVPIRIFVMIVMGLPVMSEKIYYY